MEKAKTGDTVKVHYTGKLEDGTTFDSSQEREPIEFEIGKGTVIPGFEEAVKGMSPGEMKETKVPAEQAYGSRREEMVLEIDRSQVPSNLELQVGQQLQVKGPEGETTRVTVAGLSDSKVKLDANHPLAGQDLKFEIELLEISSSQ